MRTIRKRSQESVPGVLCSDSDSSLKLLRNPDILRKFRHLEIKGTDEPRSFRWNFLKKTNDSSDLLTQCLAISAFEYHRSCLGFEIIEESLSSLTKGTWSLWKFAVKGRLQSLVRRNGWIFLIEVSPCASRSPLWHFQGNGECQRILIVDCTSSLMFSGHTLLYVMSLEHFDSRWHSLHVVVASYGHLGVLSFSRFAFHSY